MEGREVIFGILVVVVVSLGINAFYVDVALNSGVDDIGINTTYFDQTNQLLTQAHRAANETRFMEDVPILGDIVAVVGNSIRGIGFLYDVPSSFINMIGEATRLFHVPPWINGALSAFIWMLIIFIIVSAGLRYRM